MKNNIKKILPLASIIIFTLLAVILIVYFIGKPPEYTLSDNAKFYSVTDIQNEFSNNPDYKGFIIADISEDKYVLSTIEDYVEAKVGIGSNCIVSGIFFDDDRFVYEIAAFIDGMNADPTYFLLDTKYTVLYEMDTMVPIVEDENMINELNTIEEQYKKIQSENMIDYKSTKILKYDYVKLMVEKMIISEGIKYDEYKNMGLVNKDNQYYYQLDFTYKNEDTIYLVNAVTCDMIRIN